MGTVADRNRPPHFRRRFAVVPLPGSIAHAPTVNLDSTDRLTGLGSMLSTAAFFVLWWLTIPVLPSLQAQEGSSLYFDHFGPKEGLVASQVLCLGKTSDGFLWLGTEVGLIKWDAHRFSNVRFDARDSAHLPGNYVSHLMVDARDRIWMNIDGQLFVYYPATHKLVIPDFCDGEQRRAYYHFKYDRKSDILWVVTKTGLYFCKGGSEFFSYFPLDLPHRDFMSIEFLSNGTFVLVGTYGVYAYDPYRHTYKVYRLSGSDESIASNSGFFCSYLQSDSVLWVGNWVVGLTRIQLKDGHQTQYLWSKEKTKHQGILAICPSPFDGAGNELWLATISGIMRFDMNRETFSLHAASGNAKSSDVPGSGFCFLPDADGILWMGTYKGLHKLDVNKQSFRHLILNMPEVYRNSRLHAICWLDAAFEGDRQAYLFYPYLDLLLYDFRRNQCILLPKPLRERAKADEGVHNIYLDKTGRLWVSSTKYGLQYYCSGESEMVRISSDPGKDSIGQVYHISETPSGKIWFSAYNGPFSFDEQLGKAIADERLHDFLEDGRLSRFTGSLEFLSDSGMAFITRNLENGRSVLVWYNLATGEVMSFDERSHPGLLWMRNMNNITRLDDHSFFVSSTSGGALFDLRTCPATVRYYNECGGKSIGCGAYQANAEGDSIVWLSVDAGINRLDLNKGFLCKYAYYNTTISQLPGPFLSISPGETGLLVEQIGGLIEVDFYTENFRKTDSIQLSAIDVRNLSLQRLPRSGEKLGLAYDQNALEIGFTLFNFTNAEDIVYQYSFDKAPRGFSDPGWTTLSGNRMLFQGLGPGEYGLKVRAFNWRGQQARNIYTFAFVIHPPFWKTNGFYFLIFCLILAIVWALFKYREGQRIKLEKIRFFIARDLHDDMGSNLSQLRMLTELEAIRTGNPMYSKVAAKLGEVMQSMSEIIWSINPKYDHLNEVITKVQEFAIETLEERGVNLKFIVEPIPESIRLSPEAKRHFFLIFKEAINNISKYAMARNVTLSLQLVERRIIAEIRDDGIGFDPAIVHHGNGLKNMKSRAKALGAVLSIQTDERGTIVHIEYSPPKAASLHPKGKIHMMM
ncbi:MAG: hypothetical protein JPMHGGIA_01443 [Saprospiraceae bacterium]|nr:hypothetical protein [Saprospiraceae bacterium]